MNVGIFAVITLVAGYDEQLSLIDDFRGLIYRSPLLGSLLIFFLISLIGIPFTGGFFGKFYSFTAAVDGGAIALAIIGLLNSGLAAAYYLRLALVSAQRPLDDSRPRRIPQARRSASPSLPLSCSPSPPRSSSASFPAQLSTPPSPPHTRCKRRQLRSPRPHRPRPHQRPPFRYNLLNEARRIGKPAGRGTPRQPRPRSYRRQGH